MLFNGEIDFHNATGNPNRSAQTCFVCPVAQPDPIQSIHNERMVVELAPGQGNKEPVTTSQPDKSGAVLCDRDWSMSSC